MSDTHEQPPENSEPVLSLSNGPVPAEGEGDGAIRLAETERALGEERQRSLGHLRRALLAEHAGTLVPELVGGESVETLEASVEVARAAFDTAREAALAQLRREQAAAPAPPAPTPVVAAVPAGTPPRDAYPADHGALSPFQKIASGLRK